MASLVQLWCNYWENPPILIPKQGSAAKICPLKWGIIMKKMLASDTRSDEFLEQLTKCRLQTG